MKIAAKTGLLASALGLLFAAGNSAATTYEFDQQSNAVNYCQGFVPSAANSLRNRAVGVENVGSAAVNVACNLGGVYSSNGSESPYQLSVYFSNNSSQDITISCSLLTGWQGDPDAYVSTKSVVVPAGATSDDEYEIFWDYGDNPVPDATDLGSDLIGINCTLPHGGVINDMYLDQVLDDGQTPV